MEIPLGKELATKESTAISASSMPGSLDTKCEAEKRAIQKCDLHVLPALSILFMVAFLDRINIGNVSGVLAKR